MVSRVLIDRNAELVEISKRFVCLKFCETDDKQEYYRAAGYFLPQWYWQPIFAITDANSREINVRWRNTHVVTPAATLVRTLEEALRLVGEGLDAETAARNRARCREAEDALLTAEYDKALALAKTILDEVPRGGVREDALAIEREARTLQGLQKDLDALLEVENDSKEWSDLLQALSVCVSRAWTEALPLLAPLTAGEDDVGARARTLEATALSVLGDLVRISRVSVGRYRIGPDLYHDLRVEVRCRLEGLDAVTLQYAALDDAGRVWAAFEEHGPVEAGTRHRSSVLLSTRDVAAPDRILAFRAELLVHGNRISSAMTPADGTGEPWWTPDTVHGLFLDTGDPINWFHSTRFPKTGKSGFVSDRAVTGIAPAVPEDPVRAEVARIFAELEGYRFTWRAEAARYRLGALGSKCVPVVAPLAYRHGAVTTTSLLPVLARIPDATAAGAVLHNLGADDVTVKGPAYGLASWLAGEAHVPMTELLGYLESDDETLLRLALGAAGTVGKKEAFLPALAVLRRAEPGGALAAAAARAVERLACMDFGLDPGRPLDDQAAVVEKIHRWWTEVGETEPRALRMARALEAKGYGALVASVRAGGAGTEEILKKALGSGDGAARRAALTLVKDLKLRALGPQVFDVYRSLSARDADLGLARNALRDCMDTAILERFVDLLAPGSGPAALDVLLTVTGRFDLYPEGGARGRDFDWTVERRRWKEWLDEHREDLSWNPVEKRFDVR